MTHYFFHIRHGHERIEDHEGLAFPDLTAALAEAREAAREIMAEEIKHGRRGETRVFEIADESGTILATYTFSDALD